MSDVRIEEVVKPQVETRATTGETMKEIVAEKSYLILNKQNEVSPDVYMEGRQAWTDVRLVLNGDPMDGGLNGPVNIALQGLVDRSELTKTVVALLEAKVAAIQNYLREYTPSGALKVKTVASPTRPSDTSKLWLCFSGETKTDTDPKIMVTLDSGEVFNLLDGKTLFTVDGMKYAPVGDSDDAEFDVTIPGGEITLPADTTPSSEDTLPSDTVPSDTVPSDTVPSDTVDGGDEQWADDNDIATLIGDLGW